MGGTRSMRAQEKNNTFCRSTWNEETTWRS